MCGKPLHQAMSLVHVFAFLHFIGFAFGRTCNRYCLQENKKYDGTVVASYTTLSQLHCSMKCIVEAECGGYNFTPATGSCQLVKEPGSLTAEQGVVAYSPLLCTGNRNSIYKFGVFFNQRLEYGNLT